MSAAPTTPDDAPVVEVRRSRKRRRTVAAYREDDKVVVLVPARFTRAEEKEWVATMLARLERSEKRRRPSDAGLATRAAELGAKYLDGLAEPLQVRWVANQNSRWGSCTPSDRSIRLSTRLQGMPAWVIDYVLVHELAHLLESGHTPEFWSWVDRYPKAERAKGFLEGVAAASQLGIDADPPDCSDEGAAQMARDDRASSPRPGLARVDQPAHLGGVVRQVVDRPPADVDRLVADLRHGSVGRQGEETYVEMGDLLVLAAEADDVRVEVQRLGVQHEVGHPGLLDTLPQRGPAERHVLRLAVAAEVEPPPRLGVQGEQHVARGRRRAPARPR